MRSVMYVVVFLVALAVDCIPVFAPPAWPLLVFFLVRYDLNPWLVVVLGVIGTTLGRYVLASYIPWVSRKILDKREDDNLKFLGQRLSRTALSAFVFVFLYSLTPLSTTALFTAAGIAKVKPLYILPPFFIGKMISYSVLILTGQYAVENAGSIFGDGLSLKSILTAVCGLLLLLALLFIDWKELLLKKKFKLRFKIWKSAAAT